MSSPTVVSGNGSDTVGLQVSPMSSTSTQNSSLTGVLQTTISAALGNYTLNATVTQTDSVVSGTSSRYLEFNSQFSLQDTTGSASVFGTLDEIVSVGSSGETIQTTLNITSNTNQVTVLGALGRGDGVDIGSLNDTVGISQNTSGQQGIAFSSTTNDIMEAATDNVGFVKPAVGGAIVLATTQGVFVVGGDLVQASSGNSTLGSAQTTGAVIDGTSNGAAVQHTVGTDFAQHGSTQVDYGNQQSTVSGNTLQDAATYALRVAGVVPSTGENQVINNYISSYGNTNQH